MVFKPQTVIDKARNDGAIGAAEALALAECNDLALLLDTAEWMRDRGHGSIITYSPKVFIPLTQLCRDVCHYCTFAQSPRTLRRAYLQPDEVLQIAREGAKAGCHEALFTLGDKPELRYQQARDELEALGHATTIAYLADVARLVREETGLLPHVNPGVLSRAELVELRHVSVSQGLMLESSAERLCGRGGPHHGSPDKHPYVRLKTIGRAGVEHIPFTSGILIGIGETRTERIESLLSLRDLNDTYRHLQEVIIQNFRRKPGTKMRDAPEPPAQELLWTIAVARIILGPEANIQAPPNLSPQILRHLIRSGINDWGGVSPVTPDHVNPEAPWPHLRVLAHQTQLAGKHMVPRLPVYPRYARDLDTWVDPRLHAAVMDRMDSEGYARTDAWAPGADIDPPDGPPVRVATRLRGGIHEVIEKAGNGKRLNEKEIETLFAARGADFEIVCAAADELRTAIKGDTVTYVVNRNINYTNICSFHCHFCAFSKGRVSERLRDRGYDLPLSEIQHRTRMAWQRGATEVCLQGGIHPRYNGNTYINITRAVKEAQPEIHVHAFSPLEIWQGAHTLGMPLDAFLHELQDAGLGTVPGTAAEILVDEVRQIMCPDKLNTEQWLNVMSVAHAIGLTSTATIMFGHVDRPIHWAKHLLSVRDLQEQTGGFTEFVPLPFVHMEAPMYRRGQSRRGPTFRESVLMHAVARMVLHPYLDNIQTSWPKMGRQGALRCLQAGANDLGGTLMNESISRAAGASHGQELPAADMRMLVQSIGRIARQRTSNYGEVKAPRAPLEDGESGLVAVAE